MKMDKSFYQITPKNVSIDEVKKHNQIFTPIKTVDFQTQSFDKRHSTYLDKQRQRRVDSKRINNILNLKLDNSVVDEERSVPQNLNTFHLQTEETSISSPFDTFTSVFKANGDESSSHNFILKSDCKSLNRYEKFKRTQKLAILNQSIDVQAMTIDNESLKDRNQQQPRFFSQHSQHAMTNTNAFSKIMNTTTGSIKTSSYKEFRIANDLKEIQKWLDLKEIEMESTKKEIYQDAESNIKNQEKILMSQYSMFYSALKELIKLIPDKQAELAHLMKRIQEGFKDVIASFQQKIRQVHQQSLESLQKVKADHAKLLQQFTEFQSKNDLNRYFTQNLDANTRAKVIKDIEDLLKTEQYIQIDKTSLDAYRASESTRHLSDINQDYEQTIRERLNFYMQQNEKDTDHGAPIPITTFKQQLDTKLSSNYNFAITEIAKRVTQRFLDKYKKQTSDSSVQTSSFDEIKQQFESHIRNLERQLDDKEEEREKIQKEIEKAKTKLEKLNQEKKKLQNEQMEIQQNLDNQKEQQKSIINENVELRSQLKAVQKKHHKLEELHKVKDQRIKHLQDELNQQKNQLQQHQEDIHRLEKLQTNYEQLKDTLKYENLDYSQAFDSSGQRSPQVNQIEGEMQMESSSVTGSVSQLNKKISRQNGLRGRTKNDGDLSSSQEIKESKKKLGLTQQHSSGMNQISASQSLSKMQDMPSSHRLNQQSNQQFQNSNTSLTNQISVIKKPNNEMDQHLFLNSHTNSKIASPQKRDNLDINNNKTTNNSFQYSQEKNYQSNQTKKSSNPPSTRQEASAHNSNFMSQKTQISKNSQGVGRMMHDKKMIMREGVDLSGGSESQQKHRRYKSNDKTSPKVESSDRSLSNSDLQHVVEQQTVDGKTKIVEIQEVSESQSHYQADGVTSPISGNGKHSFQHNLQSIYGLHSQSGLLPDNEKQIQTLIMSYQLDDIQVDLESGGSVRVQNSKDAKTWNEACQTESFEYIEYMSDLYYNELRLQIQEELDSHEYSQLRVLLEKSRHIIEKIKFKAASHQLKFMPLTEDKIHHKYVLGHHDYKKKQELQKSKHFIMNVAKDQSQRHMNNNQDNIEQRSIKKQYQANMVFKKKKMGRNIMGVGDDIQLISDQVRKEKEDIEKVAIKIIQKFTVGGSPQ